MADWVHTTPEKTHFIVPTPQSDPFSLPFFPDGSVVMEEAWSYSTVITESYDGTEKRAGLRKLPAISVNYALLELGRGNFQRLLSLMRRNVGGRWTVPWWPSAQWATAVSGSLPAGETFTLPIPGSLFEIGGQAFVWKGEQWDLLTVSAVNGNQVTVTGSGSFLHSGAALIPARTCYGGSQWPLERLFGPAGGGSIAMQADGAQGAPYAASAVPQYKGKPLLRLPYRGTEGLSEDWRRASIRVGKDGKFYEFYPTDTAIVSRTIEWVGHSRDDLSALWNFFVSVEGRKRPFWLETGAEDMTIAINSAAGSTSIQIEGRAYTNHVWLKEAGKHIAIHHRSGGVTHARVGASGVSGATEMLALDTPLAHPASAGDAVSILAHSRLVSDSLSVSHHSLELSGATLEVIEVPQEV
jgi:hypothetical protein